MRGLGNLNPIKLEGIIITKGNYSYADWTKMSLNKQKKINIKSFDFIMSGKE